MDRWLYENEDGKAAGEDAHPAEAGVDADGTTGAGFARLGGELEEAGIRIGRTAGMAAGPRSPSRRRLAPLR